VPCIIDNMERSDKVAFLKRAFGDVHVPNNGDPSIACPSQKCRGSRKKKLAISLTTDKTHCWVCGLGGRLITLLVQHRPSFVHEYLTRFVSSAGVVFDDSDECVDVQLPAGFRMLATVIEHDAHTTAAIKYIKRRGLTDRDLWYFKFGISTDVNMQHRVIMPSFDVAGKLNFFTGRSINDGAFRKYMNSDVKKKNVIFNELNIDWSKELTLVEGPFDMTKCDENATCLLGSSLSEDSALFAKIYKNRTPIVLALDDDMVEKSWQRIAKMLSSYEIPVRIIELGSFHDVGEMTKEQFLIAKASAVSWSRDAALAMKIKSIRL